MELIQHANASRTEWVNCEGESKRVGEAEFVWVCLKKIETRKDWVAKDVKDFETMKTQV